MEIRHLGILSDTHGRLDADVLDALRDARVDLILHAGDIGGESVLARLESLAPVVAVAGNGDESLYHRYPWDLSLHVGRRRILLCHWYDNHGRVHPRLDRIIQGWKPDVVIYGHTHERVLEWRGPTLFLNPGYAGAPDPSRARSVASLDLEALEADFYIL